MVVSVHLQKMLDNVPSQQLPDICVSIVKASLAEKVQVLDAVDLAERFRKTLPLLMRQIEVRHISNIIINIIYSR